MDMERKTLQTGLVRRTALIERKAIDTKARTVQLAFSSETPAEQWFGTEILDHGPESVDLGRLNDGGALLLNHDPCEQIGVVEQASIGEDRVGRAVVRFGNGADASEVFQDVQDGIRRHVSVGYRIHKMMQMVDPDGDNDEYRVVQWEPYEISIVAIPADPTVGVGRSADVAFRASETPFTTEVLSAAESAAVPEVTPPEITPEVTPLIETPNPPVKEIRIMSETTAPVAEPTGEAAFRRNAKAIQQLAEQNAAHLKPADVARAMAEGADVSKFYDLVLERMKSGATDVTASDVGVTAKEMQRYSFMRAIQSQVPGAKVESGFERDVSNAIAKACGREAEGFFVPPEWFAMDAAKRGQRSFIAGTAGEAGNLVQTDVMGEMFTDVLRPYLVMAGLGITILPGLRDNVQIPRKTVAGTLAFMTEITGATETNPTIAQIPLSPKRISAFVKPSKQAIIQGQIGIENMLRQDLIDGAAVQIENAGISGSGTSPNPRGIRNVSGIGSVVGGTNGLQMDWPSVVALESAVANVNAEPGRNAGYLVNTKTRGWLKGKQKGTNLLFAWDTSSPDTPLNGYKAAVTNNVPSNLTKGTASGICSSVIFASDWSMHVLGLFGGLDITVDPYTAAQTGQVVITLNQYIDFATRQPGAFATMDDALTA
ncbi:MAG: phage major capsid protein [Leptothrix sp. (in: b-proteobacteria)]